MIFKSAHFALAARTLSIFMTLALFTTAGNAAFAQTCTDLFKQSTSQLDTLNDEPRYKKDFNGHNDYRVLVSDQSHINDQHCIGVCHAFSWVSNLERERKARTKENLQLSTDYLAAQILLYKSLDYLEFGIPIDTGANIFVSRQMISYFGLVPKEAWQAKSEFKSNKDQSRLLSFINLLVEQTNNKKKSAAGYKEADTIGSVAKLQMLNLFKAYVGQIPTQFYFRGKQFDPVSFQKEFFPELDKRVFRLALRNDEKLGRELEFSNENSTSVFSDIADIQKAAREALDSGKNVFLSYVHDRNFVHTRTGVMSLSAFEERLMPPHLKNQNVTVSHAVQIVGYDYDPATQKILKWKIKNSWGSAIGDGGYFHMYNDYFKKFAKSISFFKDDTQDF